MAITVGMVSLGCSKNQVDAERLLAILEDAEYVLCSDPSACDVVIINTCGFIEAAKQESIENILEFGALKEEGNLKVLVVTGCLAERYQEELSAELPEVDVVLGIGSNANISAAIQQALKGQKVMEFGEKLDLSLEGRRILSNAPYYAYLKVAEGCNNLCTFCAIPKIRGKFRSRKIEDILQEAEELVTYGVTEINVVAQDTTRYGEDLYGEQKLPELLRELAKIDGIRWIRVLYCYPDTITDELLEVMATEPKVVKYMDLPLQHASGSVLRRMNRKGNRKELTKLLEKVRQTVPGIILRTTFIAGFPGESEEEFEELCEFIKEVRFERMGCFAYSQEEQTPAGIMEDQIEPEIRQRRADILMEIQMGINAEISESFVGKELLVLCEGFDEQLQSWFGRSSMDAPDIDTKVYFTTDFAVEIGEYIWVEVVDSMDYDLLGIAMKKEV